MSVVNPVKKVIMKLGLEDGFGNPSSVMPNMTAEMNHVGDLPKSSGSKSDTTQTDSGDADGLDSEPRSSDESRSSNDSGGANKSWGAPAADDDWSANTDNGRRSHTEQSARLGSSHGHGSQHQDDKANGLKAMRVRFNLEHSL